MAISMGSNVAALAAEKRRQEEELAKSTMVAEQEPVLAEEPPVVEQGPSTVRQDLALQPTEGATITDEEMTQFESPLKGSVAAVGDNLKQIGSNAFDMVSDSTERATQLAKQVAEGAQQVPEMAADFATENFPEIAEYDEHVNGESDRLQLFYDVMRQRATSEDGKSEAFDKAYPDIQTFAANLGDFDLNEEHGQLGDAVSNMGLQRNGADGKVYTENDLSIGDISEQTEPVKENPRDAGNKAFQDKRERGEGEVTMEGVPHAFTQHKGTKITGGPLSYDPSLPGPRRRTAGGAAFDAMMADLPNLYQNQGANQNTIDEYSSYMAQELKIDPFQFPEEQRQAMVNSEVLGHISRFGDSQARSVSKMLAEGNNPWAEDGVDENGNPTYKAVVPTDGSDGVAQGTGPIAENKFNPNTGNFEVVRPAARRAGDQMRRAHTMLHEQLETGNYDTSRYLDENGDWLPAQEGQLSGMGRFWYENAEALGLELAEDENGQPIVDGQGLPERLAYNGRGAQDGVMGLMRDTNVFLNRMQRNDNFNEQRLMRGTTQNMQSPTLGPRMYANSMRNATDDRERWEVAREWGDYATMGEMGGRLHDKSLVDASAASAAGGEQGPNQLLDSMQGNYKQYISGNDPEMAMQTMLAVDPELTPEQANRQLAGSKMTDIFESGQPVSLLSPEHNGFFVKYLNDVFADYDTTFKNEATAGGVAWVGGDSIQDMREKFVEEVMSDLGIPRDQLGVKEELWSFYNSQNNTENAAALGEAEDDGGNLGTRAINTAVGAFSDYGAPMVDAFNTAAGAAKDAYDKYQATGSDPQEQKGSSESRATKQAEKAAAQQSKKRGGSNKSRNPNDKRK